MTDTAHPAEAIDAGPFRVWLDAMGRALDGEGDADVPCGECTGCCTSSQFVHIGPDEADALAGIPRELLFPAPRMPKGHVLLGYDERGHCPMLRDGVCTIYDHRPRACRTYDCRVFPAAGLELTDPEKSAIAERVRRWRFDHPTETDQRVHDAVRAAAQHFVEHGDPDDPSHPLSQTQLAVLAVRRHRDFLDLPS